MNQNLNREKLEKDGLFNVLDSYENEDLDNPGQKKPLLKYLYQHSKSEFSSHFHHYPIDSEKKIAGYVGGKLKILIPLSK